MPAPRWLPALALIVALGGVSSTALAGTPTTVNELVTEVQTTYQAVKSVRANFVQTIHNPITGKDEKKSGRIAMERPRKVRIEVGTPMESAVVSDGSTLWIYAAAQKQLIVQKEVSDGSGMSALLDNLGQLNTLFNVSMAPDTSVTYNVTLTPKSPGQYKSLQLSLTRQGYRLQRMVLVDQMDTQTVMDFNSVMMNTDVPDSLFTFKAPAGTTVIDAGKI